MLKSIINVSPRFHISIAEAPSEYKDFIGSKIRMFLRYNLTHTLNSQFKITPLKQRFPVEKAIWQTLLTDPDKNFDHFVRGTNIDTLLWIKADKSHKRFKLIAFSDQTRTKRQPLCNFPINSIEPIPVTELNRFARIISLFALAQSSPAAIYQNPNSAYIEKLEQLAKNIDLKEDLASLMPRSFIFTLKLLHAWSLYITGVAHSDTAKLGRAIRAYEDLITQWPKERPLREKGQLLSNYSDLCFYYAKCVTGIEAFEKTIDVVEYAQSIYTRVESPFLWAQLQELRAKAQLVIGERLHDKEYTSSAIHSLRTVRRIWHSLNQTDRVGHTQKHIASILGSLGQSAPGTERLEQAAAAFYEATNAFSATGNLDELGDTELLLGKTHFSLGERLGSEERIHDALKNFASAKEKLHKGKKVASCLICEAQALIHLSTYHPNEHSEKNICNAVDILIKILNREINLDERFLATQLLADALGYLGSRKNSLQLLQNAIGKYNEAIEQTGCQQTSDQLGADKIVGKLNGKLARTQVQLYKITSNNTLLDNAITSYKQALARTCKQNSSKDWAVLQSELAQSYISKAKLSNGAGRELLDSAITAYRTALSVLQRNLAPLLWAQIRNKLAEALALSGAMGGGTPCLELAVESYGKALEEWTPGNAPDIRATALNNMANVLTDLGRREENSERLEQARRAFLEAYDLFSSRGNKNFAERVNRNLSAIDVMITQNFGNSSESQSLESRTSIS